MADRHPGAGQRLELLGVVLVAEHAEGLTALQRAADAVRAGELLRVAETGREQHLVEVLLQRRIPGQPFEDDTVEQPFNLYDQGLQADVATLVDRRSVLKGLGGAGLAAGIFSVLGCTPAGTGASGSAAASGTASASPL